MNYELALKLQESNYPQGGHGYYLSESGHMTSEPYYMSFYIPTLSELIEECGDSLFNLIKRVDGRDWACNWYEYNNSMAIYGSTPEEAVANLWLELNK